MKAQLADGNAGDEVYFMGIIDILMLYTARKKFENFYKTVVEGVSIALPPPLVGLMKFLTTLLMQPGGCVVTTAPKICAPLCQVFI